MFWWRPSPPGIGIGVRARETSTRGMLSASSGSALRPWNLLCLILLHPYATSSYSGRLPGRRKSTWQSFLKGCLSQSWYASRPYRLSGSQAGLTRHLASRLARTFRALGSITTLASRYSSFHRPWSPPLQSFGCQRSPCWLSWWLFSTPALAKGALRKRVHYLVAATTSLFQTVLQSVKGPQDRKRTTLVLRHVPVPWPSD